MIGLGAKYLTAAGFGRYRITAASLGNLFYRISWLTGATVQAILGAFGDDGWAVIKATNDYLNGIAASDMDKATALAGFINEDPMMVCSLGLEPQLTVLPAMPARFLCSNGNQYILTTFYPTGKTEFYIDAYYGAPSSAIFAARTMHNNRAFGLTPYGGVGGEFYEANAAGDKTSYLQIGIFENQRSICQIKDGIVSGSLHTYTRSPKTYQTAVPLAIFADNQDGSIIEKAAAKITRLELYNYDNGVRTMQHAFVAFLRNGVLGMIDWYGGTFYTNAGTGTFTEVFYLPDGTPWTPSTP